jgi:hypothetical protein
MQFHARAVAPGQAFERLAKTVGWDVNLNLPALGQLQQLLASPALFLAQGQFKHEVRLDEDPHVSASA